MDLQQKLLRLKQKQLEVERQMAAQVALENAAVSKAFRLVVESTPAARRAAESSSALDALSTRERDLFSSWLGRIEPAAIAATESSRFPSNNQNP